MQSVFEPLPLAGWIVFVRGVTSSCGQVPIHVPAREGHFGDHENKGQVDNHDDDNDDDHVDSDDNHDDETHNAVFRAIS